MADPLIATDHVVGEWDADTHGWAARDRTAGPAGIVAVELDTGVTLDVDVADPATFVGLWVDALTVGRPGRTSPGAVDAVETLLGAARAQALFALAAGSGRPTVLAPGPDERRRRPSSTTRPVAVAMRGSLGGPGVAPGLGRLGLAVAAATDPSAGALVRGLGHLEGARTLDTLPGAIGRRRRSRPHAAAAAELLLDLHRRHEIDDSLVDHHAVAAALDGIGPLLTPEVGDGVRALALDLRRRPRAPARQHVAVHRQMEEPSGVASRPSPAAAAAPARRRPAGRLLDLDRRTLPHAFAADAVAARQTTPSEVEVRIRGRAPAAEGWWARAYGADGVIVAAAPFAASGADAVARLLVPPAAVADAEIDVTDRPGEPRPSAAARSVVAAVAAGQAAARAERLGDAWQAADRWRRSAAGWRAAGDETRAALAVEHSAGRRRAGDHRPPAPLLADRAVEATSA